jgi:signal transduction histidine kinase
MVEHIHYDKQGRPRYVEVHGYPIFDDNGDVVQIIESPLDITDRKRAEKALEDAYADLQAFVDVVSHELKNPIFAIQGFSSLFLRRNEGAMDDKSKKYIDQIDCCAKRMERLVRDLLTLSRIGKLELSMENVSTQEIVNRVYRSNEERLKSGGISLTVGHHLPTIQCDGERLEEVFQNLLSNAMKYTSPMKKPEIEIGYQDGGDNHWFYVKDNGIGIEPSHHHRVFRSFERLQESSSQEGTGLGLAIVKRIITQHHGRVWLESQKNQGAAFYFSLPKGPDDLAPDA